MPKKSKVSLKEMREWLEEYELGMSKDAIAKKAHRDVRTVDKYLTQARKEAALRAARTDLLTKVLSTHNDELLRVVNSIMESLQVPDAQLEMRQDGDGNWMEIQLPRAKARHVIEGTQIELHDEDTLRWKLLSEHLGVNSLLTQLPNWKKLMAAHIDFRKALKSKIPELMGTKTGLHVIEETYDKPKDPVLYRAIGDILYRVYANRAFNVPDGTDPEHNLKIDNEGYVSLHGTGTHLGWLSTEGNHLLDKMIEALYELGQTQEFQRLESSYSNVQQKTKKLREEFEELTLLGYISGSCRACEKLEK